ncbi:MAG: electron transfer flavoprotein subunit alpha/FixB family protein [Vicinamibacteria bacterium]
MILVIADGNSRATLEAIAAAQAVGGPGPIKVVLVGPGGDGDGKGSDALTSARVDAFLVAPHEPPFDVYTADAFTTLIAGIVQSENPLLVIAAHTYQARDVMPRVAARLDRALITDVVGVTPGSPVVFKRPMFQAKLVADVVPLGPTPHFVTVQIGAFRADAVARSEKPAPVVTIEMTELIDVRQQPEPPFREAKQAVDLTQAARIVSVGRGIKGEEHVQLAKDLAASLGAELAASRPIIDAGWLPSDRQVGSSGQTVAPKLYLALGISGAIQHVVGMKGSRTIVAINKDPDAPIFEIADYGIVGDLFEIVPAMIAELKKA